MTEPSLEEKMKYVWKIGLKKCWHEFVPSPDPEEGFPECRFCHCRRWHTPENPAVQGEGSKMLIEVVWEYFKGKEE